MRRMKILTAVSVVVAAVLVAVFVGFGSARSAGATEGRITVTGEGSVTTTPDRASFAFTVITSGKTAVAALAANATVAKKVIEALKAAGVAAPDIRTAQVGLSPRYSQNGEAILDYTASNSVSATIKNLDSAGAVVDAAVGAGADQVSGPSLTVSDQHALYRQALAAAINDAKAKAEVAVRAAGRTLGRAVQITESSASPTPIPFAKAGGAPTADSTPISPGTQDNVADVTVTYATG
jgi:uncharacterized protein YggE